MAFGLCRWQACRKLLAMEHLVLVDGHHLLYRAYWAIPRTLKTSKGEQVNTVFGVASMLLTMLRAEKPDRMLFCFDAGEDTFRHQENATYKDGRAETPDDFYPQVPRVLQLIETFGICHLSDTKYEADDLLGTFAAMGANAGMRVTVVSGDRDVLQLATDTIRIAIPHKGYQAAQYLGPDDVLAVYGIRPDQVACYKGLVGDTSDNLPGVLGIGPKTAAKLLQEYDSLDGIYANIDAIRPTVREKLQRDKEQAYFCQRMARLILDVPTIVDLDDLRLTSLPTEQITALFRELEFTLLDRRLRDLASDAYGKEHFAPLPDAAPNAKHDPDSQLLLF